MGSIYAADVYCDDCTNDIKRDIAREILGRDDIGRMVEAADFVELLDEIDQRDYDSDEYPKSCCIEDEESDTPQHCASCHEFLGNPLTSDGADYVIEAVNEALRTGRRDCVAVTVWMPYYDYLTYLEPCSHCGEYASLDDDEVCESCVDSPCDGDFTLTPSGPLGSRTSVGRVEGKFVGEFDSDEEALAAVNQIMLEEQFFPNVWNVSDHGNWSLI